MSDRSEIIAVARRIPAALGRQLRNDVQEGRNVDEAAHQMCAFHLVGSLAFLEGRYGTAAWKDLNASGQRLDTFVSSHHKANVAGSGVSVTNFEAMRCVRNAVTHNQGDLARNTDKGSLHKVRQANLPGVTLRGTVVRLDAGPVGEHDGGEGGLIGFVRLSTVVLAMFNGDG